MYDYMAALHRQFFRGPDFSGLEKDIEQTRQEVRDCLSKEERRKLLQLVEAGWLQKNISMLVSLVKSKI